MRKDKFAGAVSLAILLTLTAFLRFYELGYSDYIPDEPGAFIFNNNPETDTSAGTFLLNQRKGPIQFFISQIPYFFTRDFDNEFAQRLPFAIFNVAAIFMFYAFVTKITKSRLVGFIAAALLSTNGFVVAFGRTAQYQSLNLFFSFAALYFYSFLVDTPAGNIPKSILGTGMFSLSLLSHWDAVFITPIIFMMSIKFLLNKEIARNYKVKIVILNFAVFHALLLPFLVPYLAAVIGNQGNLEYLNSRVGLRSSFDFRGIFSTFILYNPILTKWVYAAGILLGIIFIKRSYTFVAWSAVVLSLFWLFVHHGGTHIYNLLVPLIIIAAIGWGLTIEKLPEYSNILAGAIAFSLILVLHYQSYLLFIDHKVEYPWENERIFKWETKDYTHKDNLRNKIGFPHKRYWKEINKFVNTQNIKNGENYDFYSNEDRSLSSYYMDAKWETNNGFYFIGIKRPYSFQNDWKTSQIKNKATVRTIPNERGEVVARIYRIEDEPSNR
ncbi:glycosyltransferase family 39 protein [candidate division WWE3 bacterium]|nr:glycosyltransferase family 39 protein [candidate division WWE3 bacterium]